MSSPLDDLRKISNQVNRKKIESEKSMKHIQKKERDKLSQKSFDQQKKREEEAGEVAKKTKKIKNRIMMALASLIILSLFMVSIYVHSSLTDSGGPVELISDNSNIYDDQSNYAKIIAFTENITTQTAPLTSADKEIKLSRWYEGLSQDKIKTFKKTIQRKTSSELKTKEVKYDEEKEVFEVHSQAGDDTELVIRVICDEDDHFKIIKVL
jgi:hypothetical protein